MTDKLEKISAFIDGELSSALEAEAAVDLLLSSSQAREFWRRSYQCQDLLRATPIVPSSDFAARLQAKIEALPELVAPSTAPTPLKLLPPNNSRLQKIAKPFAGMAVAAAVAAAALLLVEPQTANAPSAQLADLTLPVQGSQAPALNYANANNGAVISRASYQDAGNNSWQGQVGNGDVQQELNSLLINHSQLSNRGGYPNLVPYVRIVSHEDEQ